jgi:hypothetical protein
LGETVTLEFKFAVRLGRWGVEFSRDDGFIGLWLGLLHYSEGGSSCYPRWQWRIGRRWPVMMKQEQMPVLEFVGARLVPCELIKDEPRPDIIGDN